MEYKPATFMRRLLAMLYDILLVAALLMVASALSLLVSAGETSANLPWWGKVLVTVWLVGVAFAYYGISWTVSGQTLGLRTWHMRILNETGGSIGWGQAAVRFVCAILGFGTFLMLINKNKKSLQDIVSKSIIIDERK